MSDYNRGRIKFVSNLIMSFPSPRVNFLGCSPVKYVEATMGYTPERKVTGLGELGRPDRTLFSGDSVVFGEVSRARSVDLRPSAMRRGEGR